LNSDFIETETEMIFRTVITPTDWIANYNIVISLVISRLVISRFYVRNRFLI